MKSNLKDLFSFGGVTRARRADVYTNTASNRRKARLVSRIIGRGDDGESEINKGRS